MTAALVVLREEPVTTLHGGVVDAARHVVGRSAARAKVEAAGHKWTTGRHARTGEDGTDRNHEGRHHE